MCPTTENDSDYQLTMGPLPKSVYTYQLEEVTRLLMQKDNADVEFVTINGTNFIIFDKIKPFNITELIEHADFSHIQLTQADFDLYANFVDKQEGPSVSLPKLSIERFNTFKIDNISSLSFQEAQAINVYTGEFYYQMNSLLRNKASFTKSNQLAQKAALIHSVMCASGLSKLPQVMTDQHYVSNAYRGVNRTSPEVEVKQVDAAKNKGVVKITGFVSTTTKKDGSYTNRPISYQFTDLVGMYVAPISQNPGEQEFLLNPTDIQITDRVGTQYLAKPVSDLGSKSQKSLRTAQSCFTEKDNDLLNRLNYLSVKYSSLKQHIDFISNWYEEKITTSSTLDNEMNLNFIREMGVHLMNSEDVNTLQKKLEALYSRQRDDSTIFLEDACKHVIQFFSDIQKASEYTLENFKAKKCSMDNLNKKEILSLIARDSAFLEFVPNKYFDNFIKTRIINEPSDLKYLSNANVIQCFHKIRNISFEHASEEQKKDEALVLAVYKIKPESLMFAEPTLVLKLLKRADDSNAHASAAVRNLAEAATHARQVTRGYNSKILALKTGDIEEEKIHPAPPS